MRDVARGVLLAVLFLLVAGAIADRAGWIVASIPRPSGSGAWLIARASGLTAYVALAVEVIAGLLVSTGVRPRWLPRALSAEMHRWLSPLVLALVAGHAAVLLADDHVRFDAIDALVPFVASPRRFGVGLGVVALYATVVVHISFALRRRIGTRTWRRLHYVSFVAFVGAAVHGLVAGTDATHPLGLVIFVLPLAAVAALVALRLYRASRATPV